MEDGPDGRPVLRAGPSWSWEPSYSGAVLSVKEQRAAVTEFNLSYSNRDVYMYIYIYVCIYVESITGPGLLG